MTDELKEEGTAWLCRCTTGDYPQDVWGILTPTDSLADELQRLVRAARDPYHQLSEARVRCNSVWWYDGLPDEWEDDLGPGEALEHRLQEEHWVEVPGNLFAGNNDLSLDMEEWLAFGSFRRNEGGGVLLPLHSVYVGLVIRPRHWEGQAVYAPHLPTELWRKLSNL